jgi:hypothetical protein
MELQPVDWMSVGRVVALGTDMTAGRCMVVGFWSWSWSYRAICKAAAVQLEWQQEGGMKRRSEGQETRSKKQEPRKQDIARFTDLDSQ